MSPKCKGVPLPIELAAEIDKIVGKKNRSAFATEISEREVPKLQLLRALGDGAALRPDVHHR